MPKGIYKRKPRPLPDRFWAKVDKGGEGGCWLWTGYVQKNGYGKFTVGRDKCYSAHRLSWILTHGEEAPSELDHLCRVRHCVNPDHLQPTTRRGNNLRAWETATNRARHFNETHCHKGHVLTEDNLYWWNGHRYCRVCRAEYGATRRVKPKARDRGEPRQP